MTYADLLHHIQVEEFIRKARIKKKKNEANKGQRRRRRWRYGYRFEEGMCVCVCAGSCVHFNNFQIYHKSCSSSFLPSTP